MIHAETASSEGMNGIVGRPADAAGLGAVRSAGLELDPVGGRSGASSEQDWLALVRGVREGDTRALARLTRLIVGHLHRQGAYRLRDSWEDICQDVLIRLIPRIEEGQLRCPRAFVSYTARITHYCVLSFAHRRARVTIRNVPLDDRDDFSAEGGDPELLLALEQTLRMLPVRTRAVIDAIYLQGKRYQEAADELGLPLGTLKRLQTTGLRQLRELLEVSGRSPTACERSDARSAAPLA